jgi:hypothetical protein
MTPNGHKWFTAALTHFMIMIMLQLSDKVHRPKTTSRERARQSWVRSKDRDSGDSILMLMLQGELGAVG